MKIELYFHFPYRQNEGIIKATAGKSIPEYKRPAALSYS
jgi:hypothetical protein